MFNFSKFRFSAFAAVVFYLIFSQKIQAQTISSFEELSLPTDSFYNGADSAGGFVSGAAFFKNTFVDWGGGFTSWDGFALSNMKDSSTAGYDNQYSTYSGNGFENSDKFAVGYCYPVTRIKLMNQNLPKVATGFYVTNNTYAAISMRDGDAFSKKFGGLTGDDPDWFKLSIWGYKNGTSTDTIDFYLADYRFSDNNQDYIVQDWQWVNLESLGIIDSLDLFLSSTDNGQWGMNTPAYYCLDNFITDYVPVVVNPPADILFDDSNFEETVNLYNMFEDYDTPDSSLIFSISASSGGNCVYYYIADSILYINPLLPTKNYTCHDTLFVCASSGSYTVCDTIIIDIDVTSEIKKEENISKCFVFPNPAQENISVNSSEQIKSIEIYDLTGKKFIEKNIMISHTGTISISEIPNGIYFMKVITGNNVFIKHFTKN